MNRIKVLYINNAGGGYADEVEIDEGTTLESFFNDQVGGESDKYMISLNGDPAQGTTVLQSGNRVTVTPTNVKGNDGEDNPDDGDTPEPEKETPAAVDTQDSAETVEAEDVDPEDEGGDTVEDKED